MRKALAAAVILAVSLLAGCTPGAATKGWHWGNPSPVGEDLTAVAFGDGRFVAVGKLGNIATSPDGQTWEAASVETDAMLYGVAFGNGRFVAVGDTWPDSPPGSQLETDPPPQLVLSSRSGKQWKRGTTGAPGRLTSIAFGNGRFIAVGNNGVFSSTNGDTWKEVAHPEFQLYSIIYGGGRFVAVGLGRAITSENGESWTELAEDAGLNRWDELRSVTYGQGLFVAGGSGGYIYTSADGLKWKQARSVQMELNIVAYRQGRFLAVAGRPYWTSADGVKWEMAEEALPANISGIAAGDEMLVAVGAQGAILSSRDEMTWTEQSPALGSEFRSAAYGADRYVAVGIRDSFFYGTSEEIPRRPSVAVSRDGTAWAMAEAPVPDELTEVAYGSGVFVAAGFGIYTSQDGERWERTLDDDPQISAVVFGGGRFVAATSIPGTVYRSTDGRQWEQVKVDLGRGSYISSIAWGGGRFVGVGKNGEGLVSADGLTWAKVRLPVEDVADVAFGRDKFVAIGGDGEVLSSPDGVQWTVHERSPENLSSIAYGDGWWLAAGPRGSVYGSRDGVTWTRLPRITSRLVQGVSFVGGRFVLLGEGTILTRKVLDE